MPKLGADYQWDEATQTATATYRGVTLTMTVGQSSYQRNGETVELILGNYYDETRRIIRNSPSISLLRTGTHRTGRPAGGLVSGLSQAAHPRR